MSQVSKFQKILLQFVLFSDTLTVYAENKRKYKICKILVFTGVGIFREDSDDLLLTAHCRRFSEVKIDHEEMPPFYHVKPPTRSISSI